VNPDEGKTVQWLFERYLELKSVRALVDEAASLGHFGRTTIRKNGSAVTTRPFGRGNLYHLLSNVIYVGSIRHRDNIYDGEHQAIIDREMFDDVQRLLKEQAPPRRSARKQRDGHLLTGILYDEAGVKLRAVHANKKGVRYRYYVSRSLIEARKKDAGGWRLPANEVDSIVESQLIQILNNRALVAEWIQELHPNANLSAALAHTASLIARLDPDAAEARRDLVRILVPRVSLTPGSVTIDIDRSSLLPNWCQNTIRRSNQSVMLRSASNAQSR
jgi:hypothetical protein